MPTQPESRINPAAFEAAIKERQDIGSLLKRLPHTTCRAAHIINYSQTDPDAFREEYRDLAIDPPYAYPRAPINMLGENSFSLAQQITGNFTLVRLSPEQQPTVALRVGPLGKDEIVITNNGQLVVRQDLLITRRLTDAEIQEHARKIEETIKPSRLKNLAKAVKETQQPYIRWSKFENLEAPCERIMDKKPAAEKPQATTAPTMVKEPEIEPSDLDLRYERLTQTMQALEEIAQGKSSNDFPELIAAYGGKTITREQAGQLSQKIKSQLGIDLLQATKQFEELFIDVGGEEIAEELRNARTKAQGQMQFFQGIARGDGIAGFDHPAARILRQKATATSDQMSSELGMLLLKPIHEATKILVQAGFETEADEIWAPIFENITHATSINF